MENTSSKARNALIFILGSRLLKGSSIRESGNLESKTDLPGLKGQASWPGWFSLCTEKNCVCLLNQGIDLKRMVQGVLSARFAILENGRTQMSKSLLLMLCLLIGLLVLACAPGTDTNRNNVAPANTSTPASAATASTNTNSSTGDAIGIAECDSFLTAYDSCVSTKVPENLRAQFRTSIATWRTEWKRLADNPQTRATLAGICKTQLETARTQLKAYNCTL